MILRSSGTSLAISLTLDKRNTQNPSDIFDGHFGFHRTKGDDLRNIIFAIFLQRIVDHLAPAVHADIDVDIGIGDPFGIDKPLKEQDGSASGSISVTPIRYKTIDPAPDPRPGPIGIPLLFAQLMKSQTMSR